MLPNEAKGRTMRESRKHCRRLDLQRIPAGPVPILEIHP